MNNGKPRLTPINVNPVDLKYYPFMVSLDKCGTVIVLLITYLQIYVFQIDQKAWMLKYLM